MQRVALATKLRQERFASATRAAELLPLGEHDRPGKGRAKTQHHNDYFAGPVSLSKNVQDATRCENDIHPQSSLCPEGLQGNQHLNSFTPSRQTFLWIS
jgi:hypothetical protein